MHFNHLTAYMLGNKKHEYVRGEQWWPFDTKVWLCPNLATAEKILNDSQTGIDGAGWTEIYRVCADNIDCEQSKRGLYFTETPTKIFVQGKVASKTMNQVNEEVLLANASVYGDMFFSRLRSWKRRRR